MFNAFKKVWYFQNPHSDSSIISWLHCFKMTSSHVCYRAKQGKLLCQPARTRLAKKNHTYHWAAPLWEWNCIWWWYIYLSKLYIFHLIYSPSKYVMYEVASLKIQCHWYDWWLGPFNPHPTPFWPSRSIKAFWHSIHQKLELRGEFHVQSSGRNTIGFDVNLLSDQDHTESNLPSDQISKTRYGRHTALWLAGLHTYTEKSSKICGGG